MVQTFNAINGGSESIVTSAFPPSEGVFLSRQYTEALRIKPTPTEWVTSKRPIYDRLPAASERYKVDFSYGDSSAYAYIPYGEGYFGTTSMAVQVSGDEKKFLVIQGGNIVWKYGMIKTNPVILDLESIGISSSKYLFTYQLFYDDSPIQSQYEVSDMSLSGLKMDIRSNTDSVEGWRYTPQFAFMGGNSARKWSNYDGLFPNYNQDAVLSWQLQLPCAFSQIVLRCPTEKVFAGSATLYYMNASSYNEDGFCDNPGWEFDSTVEISADSVGQFFLFNLDNPSLRKGWRVEWSDPSIEIEDISVSGVYTKMSRPATMKTDYALAAYPYNAIPDKLTNSAGEEIPLIMCKLAYVDINSAYVVENIQDIREVVHSKYEPIAEWLTRPWDKNLTDLFDIYSNFSETWMDPLNCLKYKYDALSSNDIEVINSSCSSHS